MNEVEYILRIILKANDQMAAVLQKARTQVRAFARDSDTMNTAVTNLNQAMKNFDTNLEGVTQKLEAWRATIKESKGDADKTAKAVDNIGKENEKSAKKVADHAKAQKALRDEADRVRQSFKDLSKDEKEIDKNREYAVMRLKQFGTELERISKKVKDTSTSRLYYQWAQDAKQFAASLDQVTQAEKDHEAALQKTKTAQDDLIKRANTLRDSYREVNKIEQKTDKDRSYVAGRLKEIGAELEKVSKQVDDASTKRLYANWAYDAKQASADIIATNRALLADEERVAKKREEILARRKAQEKERVRLAKESGRADRGEATSAEIRRTVADYEKLSKAYGGSSFRARQFANEADRLKLTLRSSSSETNKNVSVFDRLSKALGRSHDSAAGFDNQLRGIGILAAVASIDQLISAAIALGGELVSLAGSAVMAGGALGGILAAGAAQALPVFGLLAGAMQRVTSVLGAVGQAQKLAQAQFTDAEKGGQKSIDQANTLANANDAVADANDRLAESRKNLTDAQKEGTDQLQDLILAEKQAALAARGAALDVKAAQEALRLAVAGGASQLEIDQKRQALEEAKLSRTQAGVGARRATRDRAAAGGDVGNLDSVKSAAKQVEDAEKAVTKANRALDQAEDKTTRAAGSTMTAAANLNFMLSQMSPAERKLYEAATKIYESYKKIFQGEGTGGSGIYGTIISAFTRAVEKVEKIMEMPKVIKGIQGLANVIGDNIDKITGAIDPAMIGQLLSIIDDAGENLGPLVDILLDLAKAFLNIAETANPAFQKLIAYVGPLVDKFLELTSDSDKMEAFFKTGEEHLESWFNLVLAIIGLFAALTGASAEEGKTTLDDLTEKIKGWTDWIQSHKEEVVAFFEDAHKAAYAIGGVLENIAVTLGSSFSGDRVEKFAGILNDIVIPALGDFIDLVGEITDKISKLLENPAIAQIAKWAVALLLLQKLASPIVGVFAGAAKGVLAFGKGIADIGKFVMNYGKHLEKFVGYLAKLPGILSGLARIAPFVFGPWGALIAAVVIGIVLLLKYFGKLDDIWKGVKDTANQFMKDITPALKTLQDALADAGIKIDDFGVVLEALKVIGGQIAEFISVYLIESFKALGKIVSGVVTAIIYTIAGAVRIIKGIVDVVVGVVEVIYGLFKGIFTGNWDVFDKGFKKILDGFENLIQGIFTIIGGIVLGAIQALEGLAKAFLAPFKAAWAAVKKFFEIGSPSKLAAKLGHNIVSGIIDGLKGLFHALTWPYRKAWNAVNDFFDGKPKKLAEKVIDEFVDRMKVLWRRVRAAASYLWEKFKDTWDAAKKFGGTIVNAIVDGFKGLPAALMKAVTDIGEQLLGIGKAIGGKIWEGIKSIVGGVKGLFDGGDDDKDGKKPATGPAKPAAATTPTFKLDVGAGLIPFGAKDLKDAENIYSKFWQELRRDARNSTDYIQRQFREMRIATSQSSDKMYESIRVSLRNIQNSFKVRGGAAASNWEKTWLDFQKTAYEGLNYIGHQTNQALKGFGAKSINFGLSVPTGGGKGGEEKAVGGWIGNKGERGRDMVHAVLGRGEAVLNWAHQPYVNAALQEKFGFGLDGLFGHTRALHSVPATNGRGFAEGGSTDTRLARLIAAANRVDAMHLPYVWGGGHTQPAQIGSGMDCSGSVSYVVQQAGYKVPTVTSGNMPSWGFKPGGDGATVFYNPEHTFMRIGSKFFGTTGFGHPGWTGAGWFTQQPSADYLSGFSQIHLPGITDVGGFAVGVGGEIAKLIVKGAKGAAKTLMQKAFDLVVPAANKFIGEQSSTSSAGPGQWGDSTTVAAGAENIFKFFKTHGFTDEQAAGWIGNLTQESGLNPGIIQPGGEGHGLAQWGHGRFDALVKFAQEHGTGDWRDLGTQLNFILYELAGSESAAGAAIRAAGSVQAAVDAIGQKYERFGIAGNRSAPAEAAYRQFKGKFAEGGTVPGPDGMPTPILAHAGEWILNKVQQSKVANWLGTSVDAIREGLGFSGGPTAYAGGGEVRAKQLKAAGKIVSRVELDLSDDLMQNVAQSLADLHGLMKAVPKIKKITGSAKPIIDLIDLAVKEGGFLEQLRGSIEKQFATTALRLRQARFDVQKGTGGQRVRVVERRDAVQQARATLTATVNQRDELTDERGQINTELKEVQKQLANKKVKGDARKKLLAQQITLTGKRDEASERIQQNEEDIFNAQEELEAAQKEAAEKRKEAAIKVVDDIKKRYSTSMASNEIFKRMATAVGNTDWLKTLNQKQSDMITAQANEIEAQIANLRAAGAGDEADALVAEVADLRAQVFEMAQQAIRDAVDVINQTASRRMGHLDLFGRMAEAMGVIGDTVGVNISALGPEALTRGGVFGARKDALQAQQAGLQGQLTAAQGQGNLALIKELTDQLAELEVSIAENTKAAREAKWADTAAAFDYSTSINDLNKQLVEATDAAKGTNSSDVLKKLAEDRLALYVKRQGEIELQLQEAKDAGDAKATQDLEKALLESKIAVQQNTKAVQEITGEGSAPASYTSTAWQWFRTALLTGTGGVMPQYTAPTMQAYGDIGPAGQGASSTVNGGATVNIEINEAGQPIDPTKLASTVVFAQSTAQ